MGQLVGLESVVEAQIANEQVGAAGAALQPVLNDGIDDPGAGPNGALLAARFTSAVPPACSPSPMQRNDPSGVGRYGAGMDLGPGCRCGMRSSGALDVEPVA